MAIGSHGWPWVARSSGVAESGRLVRRMSHRVDPAAIAEEARTVRLDAVLGPLRRSVPVGDSSTPESRTLTPLIMVRIQIPQPGSPVSGVLFPRWGESPTFPWVTRADPSLWSVIFRISVRAGRVLGAGLWLPFFNFPFGGAETGSIADRDRFAGDPWRVRRTPARSPQLR